MGVGAGSSLLLEGWELLSPAGTWDWLKKDAWCILNFGITFSGWSVVIVNDPLKQGCLQMSDEVLLVGFSARVSITHGWEVIRCYL